ncbi:MAG: helix-turn-helix transcriptional regulator [Mucilaginibacter sp.]|uniref:helix-turn-helix domain-containing protein n=1 Tax=Mucilaginibacter sp. TaxID=1882438 RepID=UPI003266E182
MEKEASLKKLGRHIQEVRKGKGITQMKLAHSVGKDRQSIQRLEAGNVNPTYYYLREIANGLGITVSELLAPLS